MWYCELKKEYFAKPLSRKKQEDYCLGPHSYVLIKFVFGRNFLTGYTEIFLFIF